MVNKIIYFALIIVLSFNNISCSQRKVQNKEVLQGDKLASFIEERNSKDGIWSGEFGEVVIMNLETKEKFYVTDDCYYDTKPVFSPDGKHIVFQSNRDEDDFSLQIKGIGGPHNVYIFSLETEELKKVDIIYQKERGPFRNTIESIVWVPGEDSLYFTIGDNKIYKCGINGGESRIIKEYENIYSVLSIEIISNKELFYTFLRTKDDEYSNQGLAYFNLDLDSSKTILQSKAHLGSWNNNLSELLYGEGLISSTKIFCYHKESQESKVLFDFSKSLVLSSSIFRICDSSFTFLVNRIKEVDKDIEIELNKNLVFYDLQSNEYFIYDEDKKDKDCLDVFVRK